MVLQVWGNLVGFIERLDDELFKSLQVLDPHTNMYLERMKDEPLFLALAQKVWPRWVMHLSFFCCSNYSPDCIWGLLVVLRTISVQTIAGTRPSHTMYLHQLSMVSLAVKQASLYCVGTMWMTTNNCYSHAAQPMANHSVAD